MLFMLLPDLDSSVLASSGPPTRRRPSGAADLPGKRGGEKRALGPRTERARELRNNMTNTEWRVWSRLRGKQLLGFKFRRQLAIGEYFVDFACVAGRLAVEIDGPLHDEESDRRKTNYLEAQGFRVTRIPVGRSTSLLMTSSRPSCVISSPRFLKAIPGSP